MIEKIKSIVPKSYNKKTIKILVFLVISMLFEALGLGLLLPIVTIILDPEILISYPSFTGFISEYGIISHKQIITFIMIVFGFLYLIKSFFLVYVSWVIADYSQGLSNHMSSMLFAGYVRQDYIESINTNSANLQRNVTNEVLQFTAFITNLLFLFSETAICISIIVTLLFVEPYGATIVMGVLIILSLIYYFSSKIYIYKLGIKRLQFDQKRIFTLIQSLSSFKEIKLFNKESFFISVFNNRNTAYYDVLKKIQVINQIPRHYFELSAVIGLVIFIISSISKEGNLNNLVAVLSVFLLAAFRLIPSSNRIISHIQAIKYASVSIDFLFNELNKINTHSLTENRVNTLFNFEKSIVIKNISYSYPNTNVKAIDKINLKIPQNSFVGIIGESGSGKSTFIDTLIGFIHPDAGTITIDNIDIHKSTSKWMSNIGYVPQTIYLSDSSLRNNIAFGIDDDNINDDYIWEAIKNAELLNFVNSLSEGIYTNVGEGGSKLSGGQRQRIGIARALYNNPQFLVFDEGTSALDVATEKSIINTILKFKNNKTIIMIAHRHSTLSECDMILEFNESKMNLK
tara:strand:+ start:180 stop:1895 length:1716 start_codon:yes stop_codon:yes gene_type:complete